MRNQLPPEILERVGRIPQPLREDLRLLIDAWYKLEQQKLTTVLKGKQLRQAQGAAQVLSDVSAVLRDPESLRSAPVPARRSTAQP